MTIPVPSFGRLLRYFLLALAILAQPVGLSAPASAAESAWGSFAASTRTAILAHIGKITALPRPGVFKVCKDQTYALCAVASCFVFNEVAYCTCDVEQGDSISLPFTFGGSNDVCTVNAEGADNGYMVSTYSLSDSVLVGGDKAIYTCPRNVSSGAYAQCDGGLCFTSTEGQDFPPGSTATLGENQIICACPIVQANPPEPLGYQIAGPYPCERSFFRNCSSQTANTNTGSTIYVGAPTGSARLLTQLLYGNVPPLNVCPSPATATRP